MSLLLIPGILYGRYDIVYLCMYICRACAKEGAPNETVIEIL